jgi:hypothetical protein
MEPNKKIKEMLFPLINDKENVLIIDEKENLNKWDEFKCVTSDDITTLKDNSFDLVVVNDFTNINNDFLRELKRIGDKFIILSPHATDISENSEEFIKDITKNDLNDMNFLDNMINQEKILKRKKLRYVMFEREDLEKVTPSNLFFNLAFIQNLRTQIVKREKEIAVKNKDIEILEGKINQYKIDLDNYDNIKNQTEKEIERLKDALKNLETAKDTLIRKLEKEKSDETNELKDALKNLETAKDTLIRKLEKEKSDETNELKDALKNLETAKDTLIRKLEKEKSDETNELKDALKNLETAKDTFIIKLEKEKSDETNELKDALKNLETAKDIKQKLIFDFDQKLSQKQHEIDKLRVNFEIRMKELEEDKNKLIEAKDEKIKKMGKELEKFKSIGWYKLFSKISKFKN